MTSPRRPGMAVPAAFTGEAIARWGRWLARVAQADPVARRGIEVAP